MIGYKLANADLTTRGNTKWEIEKTITTSGDGTLCGPGWLHYYRSPLLAVLHNPVHGNFWNPRMLKVRVGGKILHDGWTKSGCTEMTPIEEIELPEISTAQRVRYAIICIKKVYTDATWNRWADAWLSGADRGRCSADAAADAAWSAESAELAAAGWAAEAAARARAKSRKPNLCKIALEAVRGE